MAELYTTYLAKDANLQAYYRLEDVNDSTANARNLTNNNTVAFNAAKYNKGADVGSANTTKSLSTTNKLGIDGGAISVSLWVKFSTEITSSFWSFASHTSNTTQTRTDIMYQFNGGTVGILIGRTRIGVINDRVSINGSLADGLFHHIVYSYDGSNFIPYIDGVAKTGAASSGNGNTNGTEGFSIAEQTDGIQVLGNGIIDDVGVFNRALTAAEVAVLFNTSVYVQSTSTAVLGVGSTSASWSSNTTTGNLIVVGVTLTNAATIGTVTNITDNQSNTYVKAISGAGTSLGDVLNTELWYASNITGGAGSVTVNHTIDNTSMFAREYTGYSTLDVTSSALGSSTAPNTGTVTTNFGSELIVVATGDDKGASQTWFAAGTFLDMGGTATTITGASMENVLTTVAAAKTGTLTLGLAANWVSLFASFYKPVPLTQVGWKNLLGVGQA